MLKNITLLAVATTLFACTTTEPGNNSGTENGEDTVGTDTTSAAMMQESEIDTTGERNAMQIRSEIEEYREKIENTIDQLERNSIELSEARTEISQDWEKLDYYSDNDNVVRIKTYPHESKRAKTEEFYFNDGELVFALVEEEGAGKKGSEGEAYGGAFYYDNGKLIVSMNVPESDSEMMDEDMMELGTKLQEEAKSYLELIANAEK